jgi:hypothetical protein
MADLRKASEIHRQTCEKTVQTYKTNPGILEHAKASLNSFLGYIKHCSGYKTTKSLLNKAIFKPLAGVQE